MTTFNKGDVILIPFPFTDLTTTKQRPALVVSSNWFNRQSSDFIVMAISSQIPHQISEVEYLLSTTDQETSGLPKRSIIKLGKIVTINQSLIRKRLGKLPELTVLSILNKFKNILDINQS